MVGKALALATGLSFSNRRDTYNVIAIGSGTFMRRYDYKTKRDAYKNTDWCRAKRSEGKISMTPHKRDKPEYFTGLPAEKMVIIPETRDAAAAGAALRLPLDRCEWPHSPASRATIARRLLSWHTRGDLDRRNDRGFLSVRHELHRRGGDAHHQRGEGCQRGRLRHHLEAAGNDRTGVGW